MPKEKLKKIKDLSLLEIMKIHNTTPCSDCPLKDEEGNCIRSGTHYNFSDEFLNREIVVEESLEEEEQEIIKEFEESGYKVENEESYLRITLYKTPIDYIEISVNKISKCFSAILVEGKKEYGLAIDLKLYKRLNKLFSIWGWI